MKMTVLGPTILVITLGVLVAIPNPVAATTTDYFPGTQTVNKGTTSGAFPANIQTSDNLYVTPAESNQAPADTNLNPSTQTLTKGTNCGGTFPTDLISSNNVYLCHREANQNATTNLNADVETITTGTKVSGTFPTDINSDNGVSITYREANTAPAQTLAFDAEIESVRTLTTDPWTWTHTPVGTPKAIIVTIAHGTESTDCIVSVTYGSATMTRVRSDTDTVTEPGRSYIYFVGASIPTGAQTITADIAAAGSCSTTDDQFVSISYTAGANTEVLANAGLGENQANPSVTLSYTSREALAVMVLYSGLASVPITSACSGNSACTLDFNEDFGLFVSTVDRQTTRGAVNQVMGYTAATDDVAFSAVAITQTDSAANYQLSVKYDFNAETCVSTRRLTVNSWHTAGEDFLVQVVDSTETTWTTRITVTATADGTTQTYDLTADEWDLGNPNIRFIGNVEIGDTSQNDYIADLAIIQCIPTALYQMEYRLDWTSQTCAGTRRLRIEAFHTDTEDILVQVLTPPATWNTRITITATVDPNTYQTWDMDGSEWNSGSPAVRYIGSSEVSDTVQTDVSIDDSRILCTFAPDFQVDIRYDWSGIPSGYDNLTFVVECKRKPTTENLNIQVLTPPSTWNTRYVCNADVDTTNNTYLMTVTEYNSGSPAVRVIDAVPGDASASSWDLDVLKMTWQAADPIPPELPPDQGSGFSSGLMRVACSYGFGFLTCEDTTDYKSIHNIDRLEWWVDNELRATSGIHGRVVLAVGSHFGSPTDTVSVAVFVYFFNGGIVSHTWNIAVDNTISYLGFAAIGIAGIGFVVNRILDRRKEPT